MKFIDSWEGRSKLQFSKATSQIDDCNDVHGYEAGNNDVNNNSRKTKNNNTNDENKQLDNQIDSFKKAPQHGGVLRYNNIGRMNTLKVPRAEVLKAGGLSRKESYKMSRKLSRKMTMRQKQKLIMESEFDEFEDFNEDEKKKDEDFNGIRRPSRTRGGNEGRGGSERGGSGGRGFDGKGSGSREKRVGSDRGDGKMCESGVGSERGKISGGEKNIMYKGGSTRVDGGKGGSGVSKADGGGDNSCRNNGDRSHTDDEDARDGNDEGCGERLPSAADEEELILKLNMKNVQEKMGVQESSDNEPFEDDEEEDDDNDDEDRVVLTKVQKIAEELLLTEKSYLDRLHLLDQLFQMNITLANRQHGFFPDHTIPSIFSNIKSIYQFHTFLYPQLEKAIIGRQQPKVGEVLSKFGPFLKLYIEYVRNFSHGTSLLNHWLDKSPPFSKLISDLQKRVECGHLSIQHHMLEPVQRVPRYELLLKDYLRNLPADSLDKPFAEKSLQIVKEAAQHANDAMRKIEKFKKLLDVNEKLGDSIDLISPTREVVKEGRITRVARDGSSIERYIFLLNDILLVCQAGGLKQQYRIKSKMNLDDMEITESHNLEIPNTFYVRCQDKSIELHCSTEEEKLEWQMAFWQVINDYQEKMKTRKKRMTVIYPVKTDVLGKRAPLWVKDNETSMCMRCGVTFTAFRRRHHCRACGLVVCKVCSSFRAYLEFSGRQDERVCTFCHQVLAGTQASYLQELGQVSVTDASNKVMQGFMAGKLRLQVKASAASVMSGYMLISSDRHTWLKRYFAAHRTFILYSFKAHQDVVAMASLPLPGYHVKLAEPGELTAKENMFKIFHDGEKKVYYFQVENIDNFFKWINTLQMLAKLEIPESDPVNHSSFSPPLTPKSPLE